MRVGVLGGGQLSLMLAEAAMPLGIEVIFIDPAPDACASQQATQIMAAYGDPKALESLAEQVDVITYEFENIPSQSVEALSEHLTIYPGANALAEAQDRLIEKNQFVELDIPVPAFRNITCQTDIEQAIKEIGLPVVLKTRRFGYDGKGQAVIRSTDEVTAAWQSIGEMPAILEAFMPFDRELSIIAVRDRQGNRRSYPLSENTHREGILRQSLSRVDDPMYGRAEQYIGRLMNRLDYVGVLALELFQVGDKLYANEFAPRVHNSGHWTIEGAVCSQFENHIRAVAGLPLGETTLKAPSAMLNCIGKMPDIAEVRQLPGVAVHDYGKSARAGRKVGHITITADTNSDLSRLLEQVTKLIG
jgi:5-(carboxyamino)imidazole ribonucleotide synthase